ncbi:Inner membrane ABC transporter permease protein YdcV [Defluviimonas aquaemixtae]|uniref:Inner membrane ABC transporter permease protein YdcV n=1 Tax=Albidovulum aquaemixtae TaxID=1542388 RepID=A0A2R8BLI9_9RHOB|nr:ABC transporter permease [Defluviimonas aquaemixtae]SPH24260.1 Inner membrane ABC transporter permease protein YdcV [Defluviimonas aquaemixtae]
MTRANGLLFYIILYLAFLYLPVLFLPLFSFNDGTIVAFPIKGWTLEWYRQLGGQETLLQALGNSLIVGAVTALFATSMGLFAARAYVRYRFPGKEASEGLVMLPLVIPGIIVASSMLILFISIGLKPSLTAVILGHTFLALPFSVSIMKSAFDDFDVSLEEAAFDLGSTVTETFRRVTLPIVFPGIVSSLLVTFTVSFDEFVLAFFLSGNQPTLPVYIWSQIRFPAKLPNTLALGSLLLFASVLLLVVAEMFRRRSSSSPV